MIKMVHFEEVASCLRRACV